MTDDRDERDHACPNCGGETDQPGRLCAACEHNEDDAHDADDSDYRAWYGIGDDGGGE